MKLKTFVVGLKGTEFETYIDAVTAGKAKYSRLLALRECYPDVSFSDLTCHRAKTRPPTSKESAAVEAEQFNTQYPLGTRLAYWLFTKEGFPTGTAAIYHHATVVSEHAVTWLEGVPGCVLISHVERVE